ncbi:signal peptidase I [Herbaspirillum sp. alder98]|uniref:signal peptidase I n=1 Tax=Herbaspirillum sp. alder98 TaxID=2913096 RepID=UPI001CD8F124|nr:signal peptidase I [Herbaspirillum sp. alder98]MCA1322712.1 signal peptidase I [Herbaspirillum sp. alder98]
MQALLGNFALILFVLMVVTGIVWFADVFFLAKQRRARADAALAEYDARAARLSADGVKADAATAGGRADLQARLLKQPAWIEYSGSFFPVIALVFCLRSFLYEPFKIPSASMVPTLLVGDLILVNKFTYGIRLPIINKKIIDMNDPQRGDVMVFKYPKDLTVDYIKRVVGVPGDKIVYKNKRLTVNGEEISYKPLPDYLDEENLAYYKQWQENLTGVEHKILTDDRAPNFVPNPDAFPHHELCTYNADGFACTVPPGEYFMMGDNRDNSLDSRYWGFVPDQNIVGRAFFVWMNLGNLKRIGAFK